MIRNATKCISYNDLIILNNLYSFEYDKTTNEIIVMPSTINRVSRQPVTGFNLSTKIRKFTFTEEMIKLWLNQKYHLTLADVMYGYNLCQKLCQPLIIENIYRICHKGLIHIKLYKGDNESNEKN